MFPLLIIVALVAVAAVIVLSRCIKVIHEGQVAIVLRLGRFDRVARPGLAFIPPLIDEFVLVETTPRRYTVPAAGFTRDGIRVAIDIALVARVTQAPLVLRHSKTLASQAADATANVVVTAIGTLAVSDLALGGEPLLEVVRPRLDEALGAIGLGIDSLRTGPVQFPAELTGALAGVAVAAHRRQSDLVFAETARLVSGVQAQARADQLVRIDKVARRLDERTLVLERFALLRTAAEHGGQVNVLTGLEDSDLRPALPLPPPRLRGAS